MKYLTKVNSCRTYFLPYLVGNYHEYFQVLIKLSSILNFIYQCLILSTKVSIFHQVNTKIHELITWFENFSWIRVIYIWKIQSIKCNLLYNWGFRHLCNTPVFLLGILTVQTVGLHWKQKLVTKLRRTNNNVPIQNTIS